MHNPIFMKGLYKKVKLYKLTTGMTWVTPSPESITVPVKVLSLTCLDVHDAANAKTAC